MNARHGATFADLLRRYRKAAGLTQEELAAAAGLSTRAVSDLERGLRRSPHRDTLHLLAEALHLTDTERGALAAAAKRSRNAPAPAPITSSVNVTARGNPMSLPLVGRTAELARIERLLSGGEVEGSSVLLLAGEPGIGKTRLLQEAMRLAAAAGWTVLEGGCQRRNGQMPYSPLLEAIERYIMSLPLAVRREQLRGCEWLVRLLPELATHGIAPGAQSQWVVGLEQERRLMFAAAERLLANAAGRAGTLLVVDDLQWAGPDALDLLDSLLHSPLSVALRVLGAYRDTELAAGDPLSMAIGDLSRQGFVDHMTLKPLTLVETRELLQRAAGRVGDAVVEQVVARSGGVPFFALSLARAVLGASSAAAPMVGSTLAPSGSGVVAATEQEIPWTAAQSVQQRVARLPAMAQVVLAIAAVAGRVTERDVLRRAAAAVGCEPPEAVVAALEDAVHARLMLEEGDRAYRFAHDLIRETILGELSAARRELFHRVVGVALEARAGGLQGQEAVLAWHFAQAGLPERALPYALLAGERAAAVYAHVEAARHYRRALDLAQQLGDGLQQAVAAEGLGIALSWWQGRDETLEALEVLEWVLETALARHDWSAVVRIANAWTRPYVDQGRPREGIARIEQVGKSLAEHEAPPGALAALDVALTHLFYGTNQYAEMLAAAERALAAAQGDSAAHALALWRRGAALQLLARLDESLPDLEQAAELAAQGGHSPTILLWAWHSSAGAWLHLGDLAAARAATAHALEVAETFAAPDVLAVHLSLAAQIALETGDGERARDCVMRAESILEQIGADWARATVAEARGRSALAEGDIEAASHALDEALAYAQQSGDLQRLRAAQHLLAERDLLADDPTAAIARLTPLLDRPGLTETDVNPLLPTLAEGHLAVGDTVQAEALIASACDRLRAQHDRFVLAETLRIKALVALRQGRRGEAQQSLEEASVLCREMGAVRLQARVVATQRALAATPRPASVAIDGN